MGKRQAVHFRGKARVEALLTATSSSSSVEGSPTDAVPVCLDCPIPCALLEVLRLWLHTVRHVPGEVRPMVQISYSALLAGYAAFPSDVAFWALMAFPKLVLGAVGTPSTTGKGAGPAAVIQRRLRVWEQRD